MRRLLLMFVAVAVVAGACTCNFGTYGMGETYGYVTTVEDNGTWYAVHIRASYNTSQTDCYNVDNRGPEVVTALRKAVLEETRIKATFKKERRSGTSSCSTGTVIGVEFLETPTPIPMDRAP